MLAVTALSAGALIGGAAATAASRGAPRPDAQAFDSGFKVKTSTHRSVLVSIVANRTTGVGGTGTVFEVQLSRGPDGNSESHSWEFPVPNSAFRVGPGGSGVINIPAAKLAPYGMTRLSFKPAGKLKKRTCAASAYVTTQKVKVSGAFYFDSRSKGKQRWGHLGSKRKRSFMESATVESAYGQNTVFCIGNPRPQPCEKDLNWTASTPDSSLSLDGGVFNKHGFLDAERFVSLAKPNGATRTDYVDSPAPAPKLRSGAAGSATVSIGTPGGVMVGKATLTSSATGSSFQDPCGKNKTQTDRSWMATYQNGKPPLMIKAQIFGALKLPDGTPGVIDTSSG